MTRTLLLVLVTTLVPVYRIKGNRVEQVLLGSLAYIIVLSTRAG